MAAGRLRVVLLAALPALLVSINVKSLPTHMLHADGTTKKPLREGDRWSTYCSHVQCEMREHMFADNGDGVLVHHSHLEQFGNRHICKEGMHREGKCGCECFDEMFGLGFQLSESAKQALYFQTRFGYEEGTALGLPMRSAMPTFSPTIMPTDPVAEAKVALAKAEKSLEVAKVLQKLTNISASLPSRAMLCHQKC